MDLVLTLIIILVTLFSFYFLYPFVKSYTVRGNEMVGLSGVIPDEIQQKQRYLLYLWSPSCGMCRGMSPIIDSMIRTRDDVAKIDVLEFSATTKAMGVMGTPALIVVEKGVVAKVSLGAKTKKAIVNFFDG